MRSEQTNIRVAVRLRPLNSRESGLNQRNIIKVLDDTTLLFDPDEEDDGFFFQGCRQNYRDITKRVNKKLTMEYDRVFDTTADNISIFEECTAPLVDGVLNGYNSSVFVYGATGAGKTFTMLGSETCPGLTFLTMRDLFQKIESQSETRKFEVGVSYLEVYNEHVMNLINKQGPLKLREDGNGVVVSGLVLNPITNANELLQLLKIGNANRTQHPTDANEESSRSHAIFQVHLRMTDRKTGTKRTVKLSMIDLAGSERASSTKGIGARFKEGASINRSLLALGNCINKLADGLKHIPYRDSNLTRILKDSLGGNCQTLMVANVSMSSLTYEDTYNTLKYASRAKKIRTNLRQNIMKSNMPKEFYIKKVSDLVEENDKLKDIVKSLEAKVAKLAKKPSISAIHGGENVELNTWYQKIDDAYADLIKVQEDEFNVKSKIKCSQYRIKVMKEAEILRTVMPLNKPNNHPDNTQITNSLKRLDKQVEKQKIELLRRRKRHQDALRNLEQLKKQINESNVAEFLESYMKSKDSEIEKSKQNVNLTHISSINSELVANSQRMLDAFSLSCGIVQKSYEKLSALKKLSPELQKKHENLQRNLSLNIIPIYEESKNSDEDELSPGSKRENDGSNAESLPNKRQCLHPFQRDNDFDLGLKDEETMTDLGEHAPTEGNTFMVPHINLENPNDTRVLHRFDEQTVTSNKNSAKILKSNLVNNILSDHVSHVPSNKDKLQKALINAKNFNHYELVRTVAVGVQKENKKFSPNMVRKSPHCIMSRAMATSSNLVRKQAARTNTAPGPIVRTNRAASFRAKK